MKSVRVLLIAAVAGIVFASVGEAAPRTGFGFNLGVASHNIDGTLTSGMKYYYSSSGLSLGIDYQMAMTETISLSPFLMTSGENGGGDLVSGTTVGHGILGLEGRFWLDRVFIGGHAARYTEVLTNSNGSSTSAAGIGVGLTAGWEDDHGGLFVMTQIDKAKLSYADADNNLTGFRLSIGYRW